MGEYGGSGPPGKARGRASQSRSRQGRGPDLTAKSASAFGDTFLDGVADEGGLLVDGQLRLYSTWMDYYGMIKVGAQ